MPEFTADDYRAVAKRLDDSWALKPMLEHAAQMADDLAALREIPDVQAYLDDRQRLLDTSDPAYVAALKNCQSVPPDNEQPQPSRKRRRGTMVGSGG